MTSKFFIWITSILLLSNLPGCSSACEECQREQRIFLTPDMVISENAVGNSIYLVDEQSKWSSEQLSFRPEQIWKPEFTWNEPLYLAIDLQGIHSVTGIAFYRDAELLDNIEGTISLYYGEPFQWNNLVEGESLARNEWQHFSFSEIKTRYLRVKIEGGKVSIGELFCFGTKIEDNSNIVLSSKQGKIEKTTFDEMLGINAFVDDPIGRLDFFGFVREYHNWRWVEHEDDLPYPENRNHWSPGGSKWDFDQFYRNMSRSDILVCPSIKENLKWLRRNHWEINTKPLLPDEDATDPSSYIAHADHMFQYAARYGNTNVADSLLKLADDQLKKSGLGYVQYFENWNEQNIWWKGRAEYFTPYEFAAMSSADYDGHLQLLGTTVGLKNADPTAKLVMSGLASLNLDYVKAVKFWSDHNRDGSFPADVLNFHHYSRYQSGNERHAISPEEDSLQAQLEVLVNYRDQHLPDHELWLTEFGYDTNSNSPQGVSPLGDFSNEEVQGMWLVRSLLAASAAGIDRASIYMLRDVKDDDPSLYNTSGITSSKQSGWQPKPAWYYLKTLSHCLEGMQFEQSMPTTQSSVEIFKYTRKQPSANQPNSAYVVWNTTSSGEVIDNYHLQLDPREKHGYVVELSSDGQPKRYKMPVANNQISISISEKPIVILVNDQELDENLVFPAERQKLEITSQMISFDNEEQITIDDTMLGLIDEQLKVGDPIMGSGVKPQTNWKTNKLKPQDYPFSAYIDLGEEKFINVISLFDSNSEGDLSISIGEAGDWQPIAVDRLMRYNKWSHHIVNAQAQFIRLTKQSSSANIGEVVIYAQ